MQIHNSSLTRFGVGGEHDVESVDEHGFDVCSGKGSDESHIEGSQDVGSFVGQDVGRCDGTRSNVGSEPSS